MAAWVALRSFMYSSTNASCQRGCTVLEGPLDHGELRILLHEVGQAAAHRGEGRGSGEGQVALLATYEQLNAPIDRRDARGA